MSAIREPGDEVLLTYASGTIDPGLSLLVEAHLELSAASRARLAAFNGLAGAFLRDETPAGMKPGSLALALARIKQPVPELVPLAPSSRGTVLSRLRDVRWRWAGPGSRIAPVSAAGSAMRMFLLRSAPGRALARHGHSALEWTVIMQGSYCDEHGHFPTGSFIEETAGDVHRPVVNSDVDCLCLIAMQGPIIGHGLGGMVASWIMR